jgi:threonine/homoserine/homoserine lactone efflux protein
MPTLLTFCGVTFVLVATPGPGVLYVVGRSIDQGRRAGLVSMLAIESAELVYVLATAFGLAAVLASSANALDAVRIAGGAYLIVIGIRRWRRDEDHGAGGGGAVPSGRRVFAQGFVVQLMNPKVAVFFLAYFPQFIRPGSSVVGQVLLLGALYIAIAAASDAIYVLASSALAARLTRSVRSQLLVRRGTALLYMALGGIAALSGSRSLAARRA